MRTARAPSPAPDVRARILLVDDDPMITQLIIDMLSLDGVSHRHRAERHRGA